MTDVHAIMEALKGGAFFLQDLCVDSREVQEGDLFIQVPSLSGRDPSSFIAQALERGACGVVLSEESFQRYMGRGTEKRKVKEVPLSVSIDSPFKVLMMEGFAVPFIIRSDPQQDVAVLGAQVYPHPSVLVAVTGTNGKSSTVEFVRQFWAAAGIKGATLGTLGLRGEGGEKLSESGKMTSPDLLTTYRFFRDLVKRQYTHVALEASSHGLDQRRFLGLPLNVAGFTNLTQDHLDYHATQEDYFIAKTRLFREVLPEGGTAVLNADSPVFDRLQDMCRQRSVEVLSYGMRGQDLRLHKSVPTSEGQDIQVSCLGQSFSCLFPLWGDFQVMNALCAAGIALKTGISWATVREALAHLAPVPGRLQRVGTTSKGASVFVDYAHTPDALKQILKTLRPYVQNRLHVVLGCGGDRDSVKRPLMGAVACAYADQVVVTDDNPRTEDPALIRKAVLAGCPGALEIAEREEAIYQTLCSLEGGDLLVVAGKGHEQGQVRGTTVFPFDDVVVIQQFLSQGV